MLLLAPLLYWLWEREGADALQRGLRPATIEAIRVGTPAPDFTVPASRAWNRKDFQLSSLKGHPVVLHFWATWCGPCLTELPELLKLADERRKEGFSFVAVAIDPDWATLEAFFQSHPELSPMKDRMVLLLDPEAELAGKYRSSRFPETFLINTGLVMDNKFIGAQAWSDPGMAVYLDSLRSTGR